MTSRRAASIAAAGVGAAAVVAGIYFLAAGDDEPTTVAGHGLSVRLPAGWEGGVLPPRPPERPGPVLRASADGALVIVRDVTAAYAPLASPLGFPRLTRPPTAARTTFRAGGRLFDRDVQTTPELLEEARAVLSSLAVRPLARRPPGLPRARMQAIPVHAGRVCRASRLLRPVCVTRVPAGDYPRSGLFLSPIGRAGSRYDVFELNGLGAPARRLVLLAGRYGLGRHALADWGRLERGRSVGLRGGLTRLRPPAPLLLSAVRWGGREGVLVLDDADGGPLASHLVFRWRARGVDYAAALRAWEPLPEAVAALRAAVLSIPR